MKKGAKAYGLPGYDNVNCMLLSDLEIGDIVSVEIKVYTGGYYYSTKSARRLAQITSFGDSKYSANDLVTLKLLDQKSRKSGDVVYARKRQAKLDNHDNKFHYITHDMKPAPIGTVTKLLKEQLRIAIGHEKEMAELQEQFKFDAKYLKKHRSDVETEIFISDL
jgi:hypothetical protein